MPELDAVEDHKRDCLARWLLRNREAGRRMWKNWQKPIHHASKPRAWLEDMRRRVKRLKEQSGQEA